MNITSIFVKVAEAALCMEVFRGAYDTKVHFGLARPENGRESLGVPAAAPRAARDTPPVPLAGKVVL
jgi:hypothetical protein